ncbi:aldehyde dehydrogenase family protein, partial [Stenotrophomonas sp.]
MTASSPWLPDELWSGAFFDGQWQAAAQRQPVIEPATGQTLGEVGLADAAQVATSAATAAQAQQAWAAAPYEQRAQVLRQAARLAEDNMDTLVDWLVRESG